MSSQEIVIKYPEGMHAQNVEVWIDGVQVRLLRGVKLEAMAGEVYSVELTILGNVKVESIPAKPRTIIPADVDITDLTGNFKKFGRA